MVRFDRSAGELERIRDVVEKFVCYFPVAVMAQ
jgi:hypothetical protein